MKNWQCSKCGVVIQAECRPAPLECQRGGSHAWEDLGNVGSDNYQCAKCGMLIKSESKPVPLYCPQKNHTHDWRKL